MSMYRAVTRSIQITVEPKFVAEESAPDEGRWFWAYQVEIINLGLERVQLRSRYWRITDATGRVQEVRGAGVVGEQPVLEPGESFTYTSGCPLPTPSGIMAGAYRMEGARGESFDVAIPAFSLDLPDARRTLN
jgi:ApaG protein